MTTLLTSGGHSLHQQVLSVPRIVVSMDLRDNFAALAFQSPNCSNDCYDCCIRKLTASVFRTWSEIQPGTTDCVECLNGTNCCNNVNRWANCVQWPKLVTQAMHVSRNNSARSHRHCCHENATRHFLSISVDPRVAVNNIRPLSFGTETQEWVNLNFSQAIKYVLPLSIILWVLSIILSIIHKLTWVLCKVTDIVVRFKQKFRVWKTFVKKHVKFRETPRNESHAATCGQMGWHI
jgi:hypothetical protein